MAIQSNGAVIRRVEVSEEHVGERVLHRHLPAWVISGAVHVGAIAIFAMALSGPREVEAKTGELVSVQVEDPAEDDPILVNPDVGFDPNLAAATDAKVEADANVTGPTAEGPPGLDNQPDTIAPQTMGAGLTGGLDSGDPATVAPDGSTARGAGGSSPFVVPGMQGRTGETKNLLLKRDGGSRDSEAAVARGLAWLARKQLKEGSWEFDGSSKDKVAATGMALLPFLAAGETHRVNTKYRKTVENGLNWLLSRQVSGGSFGTNNMYAHAIATVALCEAAGMTRDPNVKAKATLAVNYIVRAQCRNGSWGYTGPMPPEAGGDTSIVGWQIQALASAKLAEIKFERDKVYKDANRFLESVSSDSGSRYGYRDRTVSQTLTPVGLLAKYYMGEMGPRHPAFGRGVEFLKQLPPQKGYFDMYYYYYATQVVHFYEGPDWHKFWNPKMRDLLIDLQRKGGGDDLLGSWDKDQGFIGSSCGRLGTTCLALLTLEVYYRHLPLYKRDSGGLVELER
jgi:hypothetical protein